MKAEDPIWAWRRVRVQDELRKERAAHLKRVELIDRGLRALDDVDGLMRTPMRMLPREITPLGRQLSPRARARLVREEG